MVERNGPVNVNVNQTNAQTNDAASTTGCLGCLGVIGLVMMVGFIGTAFDTSPVLGSLLVGVIALAVVFTVVGKISAAQEEKRAAAATRAAEARAAEIRADIESRATVDAIGGCMWCGHPGAHRAQNGHAVHPRDWPRTRCRGSRPRRRQRTGSASADVYAPSLPGAHKCDRCAVIAARRVRQHPPGASRTVRTGRPFARPTELRRVGRMSVVRFPCSSSKRCRPDRPPGPVPPGRVRGRARRRGWEEQIAQVRAAELDESTRRRTAEHRASARRAASPARPPSRRRAPAVRARPGLSVGRPRQRPRASDRGEDPVGPARTRREHGGGVPADALDIHHS